MSARRPRQAVLLAGGRGTRLAPITDATHKGMVRFAGKPFMEHILARLIDEDVDRFLFLLGYRAGDVIDHFGDGSKWGVTIEYDVLEPDDLTAKRVLHAWDKVDETFLLLYCDNWWPIDLDRMMADWDASGMPCLITVYSNEDDWTKHSVIVEDGRCTVFDRTRTTPNLAGVEIGFALLHKDTVKPHLPPDGDELFEQAVYPPLAEAGQLAAHWTRHRYVSVGGHARLPITRAFFEGSPVVLLDRDGTLIERAPKMQYTTSPDDVRWLPGALDALRLLRESGHRILLVSNQAGIERGMLTQEQVEAVNGRLLHDAIAAGGWIDGWYTCPHHWDTGCDCRKPSPGMLHQAQREHHFDLTRTWFFGDDERDGFAAHAAGAPFAQIDDERTLLSRVEALLGGTLRPDDVTPPTKAAS